MFWTLAHSRTSAVFSPLARACCNWLEQLQIAEYERLLADEAVLRSGAQIV